MELTGYIYNCSGGETFDSIAREVYKNEKYAPELLSANPELDRKSVFLGGEKVLLPKIDIPTDDVLGAQIIPKTPPWKE